MKVNAPRPGDHFPLRRLRMGAGFSTAITLPYGRERGWVQSGAGQPFGTGSRSYTSLARTMYRLPGREYDTWGFRRGS